MTFDLRKRRNHYFPEVPLILGVEGNLRDGQLQAHIRWKSINTHHSRLMRSDNGFTSPYDTVVGISGQLIC